MKTEFELRILNINKNEIQKKLEEIGAEYVTKRFMRRKVYDLVKSSEEIKDSWMRLRDNGEKTTITVKEIYNDQIDGTKELEMDVEDFDKASELLEKLGLYAKAYQENQRTSYRYKNVEIEIDEWPLIPTYLEIEGHNIESIELVVKELGYQMEQTTSIGVLKVYESYGIDLNSIKKLTF
ncbi:MAG TPA: CYTH domain-containing protein [Candidatus Gracilibacteria bacterium]|nr:CYTH domain-containing protein [Candidatus Gracilibacteria bacterium]